MKIAEFSVKHSLLINLISVFILIIGFYTLFVFKIRREAFPEVSYDVVIVSAVYPGAAPEEVEKFVTVPLEKELKGVDGIDEMSSTSRENISNIQIKINQDVKDKKKVVDDIRQAVDRVNDLPEAVEDDPLVTEITSGEIPVVQVALSGEIDERELQGYADRLEDIIEEIPGVSSVSRKGWRDQEVWVELNPDKLQELYVSMDEIMEALRRKNISVPGGKVRGQEEFSIRTTGEFFTADEIAQVIIRANEAGNWLRIKDVASVRFTFEDEDIINKSFGTRSISLIVVKRATGDAIKIVDKVRSETERFIQQANPDLQVNFINDLSYYIRRRLGVLKNNGIIALVLVCAVLMLFLDKRVAILTALGIPIAFSATFAIMGIADISVNLVTMFGLIVVLGMLVDDGIIIAENCSRHLEEGLSPREAAIIGTQEVIQPVTTTIITTVAAFAPLLFMGGMMGKFIWGIPLVVIIALSASLFEALVILPSHFADFVRVTRAKIAGTKETHWFKNLIAFYTRVITGALNRRYRVLFGLMVVFFLTVVIAKSMPFVLFGSDEGIEQFYVRAEAPAGTNLYITNDLVRQIEEKVSGLPESELESYTTQVGTVGETWHFDPYGKDGSHVAQLTVYLTPYTHRQRNVRQIMDDLKGRLKDVTGFEQVYFDKDQEGPPVGKPVSAQIRGEDFAVLETLSQEVTAFLSSLDGVLDINSDYETGRGEIRVVVDEDQAARAQLTVGEIAAAIRTAFKGGIATSIKPVKAEEEINVLVRFPEKIRSSDKAFESILISNKFGNLIPLSKLARLEETESVTRIKHLDGRRVVTVNADVNNKKITSFAANKALAEKFQDVSNRHPGYRIEYGGEQEENVKSISSFKRAFALAFLLIFLILAANFNSLVQPFVVMLAIPFGLIGVVWAFFFHGYPISFFMMMGVVGLIGIVVNDSIVLVEFINSLRRKGTDRRSSIVRAGQLRLRPVLLTSITTAFGLAPTAYGIGGGDPFLKPMALTILWGIVCATVLTLVVLPCIYAIIDDIVFKVAGHATVKENSH